MKVLGDAHPLPVVDAGAELIEKHVHATQKDEQQAKLVGPETGVGGRVACGDEEVVGSDVLVATGTGTGIRCRQGLRSADGR